MKKGWNLHWYGCLNFCVNWELGFRKMKYAVTEMKYRIFEIKNAEFMCIEFCTNQDVGA